MAAGIATLKCLRHPEFYRMLDERSAMLETGIREAIDKAGVGAVTSRVGSMLGLFFTEKRVSNFAEAQTSNLTMFAKYFKGMLEQGIYLAPSQYEALFMSSAHSERDIQTTIQAMREVFSALRI
jgi:glutamate-1-semialdehyde 2,1-aminomutase